MHKCKCKSIAKKAQQSLYFLHQLRKFNLLKQFYSAIIESVLCSSITVSFGSATKSDIKILQRTVRAAERNIGAPLPSLQELHISRVRKRAKKITLDPSPSPLSLQTVTFWSALQHTEQQNSQAQEQFFSHKLYSAWTIKLTSCITTDIFILRIQNVYTWKLQTYK